MCAYENQFTQRVHGVELIVGYEWVDPLKNADWHKWYARSYQFTQWAIAAVCIVHMLFISPLL